MDLLFDLNYPVASVRKVPLYICISALKTFLALINLLVKTLSVTQIEYLHCSMLSAFYICCI